MVIAHGKLEHSHVIPNMKAANIGNCELFDTFGIFVQVALGVLSFSALVSKPPPL